MARQPNRSSKIIQSVDRALEILDCFNGTERELPLGVISSRLQLNKSTALGLINTLIFRGYMEKSCSTGKYRLGHALLEKQQMNLQASNAQLRGTGTALIRRIALRFGVRVYLFSCFDLVLTCVDCSSGNASSAEGIPFYRLVYHASAPGKLVLSRLSRSQLHQYLSALPMAALTPHTSTEPLRILEEIDRIRTEGAAFERSEVEEGTHACAVPILDSGGKMIGVLSASGPAEKMTGIRDSLLDALREASAQIAESL